MDCRIYTIGLGNKSIEELIGEIRKHNIEYVIDIRSKPYSKYNPHHNKETLSNDLEKAGMKYLYLGNLLGGLPDDQSCYTADRKIDYEKVKEKEFFKTGLSRIVNADKKGIKIVMMCSEKEPAKCHRSKMIGVELQKLGIEVCHIVDIDTILSQNEVINELTKGFGETNLFGDQEQFTSRKSH